MASLKGTDKSPAVVESPIDRVSIQKQGTKVQKDALAKRLQEWTALKNTKLYHVLTELADPMIFSLGLEIVRPVMEYPADLPLDKIRELKAECRGELRVWHMIKYGPGSLRAQLDQLDELEEREGKRKGEVSEDIKKKLANYA